MRPNRRIGLWKTRDELFPKKESTMQNIKTENFEDFGSRKKEEIGEAIDTLRDQVWYNRHCNLKINLEDGVATVDPEIWREALGAAEDVRAKYPESELGPWTDFEWGMINGKLSALRWVLGGVWDDLDT
jgi:hypothetical protein